MAIRQRLKIKPLSVNEAWQGRRFKTDKYKAFEKLMTLRLKPQKVNGDQLSVSILFGFSSKLSDLDNPVKLTLDILCKKFGFDDRQIFLLIVEKEIVKKGGEFIDFRIEYYLD